MGEAFEAVPGRLDAAVARHLGITRAGAQRAIASGGVRVDGTVRPKSHRLTGGERVEVDLRPSLDLPAERPALGVRFRDKYLLVVAKPAGMATHPTENRRTGTVVNRLLGADERLASRGAPLRPGIVHRLDAGTSGLLVVASDDETHDALAAMFAAHDVKRRYLALLRGVVATDRFEVDAPLGRHGARIRLDATGGRAAATAFAVRERLVRATLVAVAPRTGRTHQIRVHAAAVGHPVLGDARYGGGGEDAHALGLVRPFLHAWRLVFDHPITGERIDLEEPLPEDLERALGLARGRAGPRGRPGPPP